MAVRFVSLAQTKGHSHRQRVSSHGPRVPVSAAELSAAELSAAELQPMVPAAVEHEPGDQAVAGLAGVDAIAVRAQV